MEKLFCGKKKLVCYQFEQIFPPNLENLQNACMSALQIEKVKWLNWLIYHAH